ncbi:MAG: universal stress protein [Candidatus Rokubacteria bacterium]|nr:universal stress protein [Candidatus Rokubacteria bacterium]
MAGLTIRQILFPTDFSDASRLAGTTAFDLARQFGARLHVLHVVPPVTDPTPAPAHLRAVAEELDRGLSPVTAITSGLPARQIVAYARKNAIDLIVIGTHGRTGVTRALLGSVAEAVVRRAPCRVLTVPPELHAAPPAAREMVEAPETTSCAVCGANTRDELICEACRAKIRGEALDRKLREERAGR